MSCRLEQTGPAQYRLVGEFCVQHAADLLPQWLALGAGAPVSVELGDVAEIDTAGLQLLLMLKRLAPAVSYRNPSAAVAEALALVALTESLSDTPTSMPGETA